MIMETLVIFQPLIWVEVRVGIVLIDLGVKNIFDTNLRDLEVC